MNILIVSATEFEVKPLCEYLGISQVLPDMNISDNPIGDHEVKVLITGIGMVNTAFSMGRYSNTLYDLVLNVGVCGAFDRLIKLGDVVEITEDVLSELGAEDGDAFLTYDKLNLPGDYQFKSHLSRSFAQIDALKKVKGITVNTVHGNEISINKVKTLFKADVESMEGAAFFASIGSAQNNYTQIRAVSNYVEKRDKSKWQMSLAISNLNNFLIDFVKGL